MYVVIASHKVANKEAVTVSNMRMFKITVNKYRIISVKNLVLFLT